MKVFLVIGSNSFSGSHFVQNALERGDKVYGVSRSKEINDVFLPYKWNDSLNLNNFIFNQLDINFDLDKLIKLIDKVKPQYIVNFAAQGMVAESWTNPSDWYKTNLLSQVKFHDELRKRTFLKKYVHVTTPEVYGSTNNGWIKENYEFHPNTPYAVSRAACDLHLVSFFKAYKFPVVFTRSANVYGPGQQLHRIIPRTFLSIKTKKPLFLHGGGLSERSFIYITDVVKATYDIALKAEPGTTWHLSTNQYISIKELVRKMCELSNVNYESIVEVTEERLGKDQSYLLDSSKVREMMQWEDKISLNQGLDETFKWVNENIKLLKTLPWSYKHKS